MVNLGVSELLVFSYEKAKGIFNRRILDDEALAYFPPGRLAFKEEGAGKQRVFAIPNAFKQALLRPAHDWCMDVLRLIPMDGTYNQVKPLDRLKRLKTLFSFDLSSATDRFPLAIQGMLVEALFNLTTAFAWVRSGLGTNCFSCPSSNLRSAEQSKLVRFATGQPLGFLSSWPLFALCHHFIVWYCADQVYPSRVFNKYALLGDDIVIGDRQVAKLYQEVMDQLGVSISKSKSGISECGALEFAKKFRIQDRDLSPISVKMLRAARHSVAWMPVCKNVGVTSVQLSLRLRGAGYRRYSAKPEHINPNYNRHWFRHILVALSPGGICPMPFQFWLGFPDGIVVTPYLMGMVRQMLFESCNPDWDFMQRMARNLHQQLDDEAIFLTEHTMVYHWMRTALEYEKWYIRAKVDYDSITTEDLLDPPAFVFRPDRKDQLMKFFKNGRLFRCYDLIRQQKPPLPLGTSCVRFKDRCGCYALVVKILQLVWRDIDQVGCHYCEQQ